MKSTTKIWGILFLCLTVGCCSPKGEDKRKTTTKNNLTSTNETQDYFIDIRDGKRYKTEKIGTQTWFAENLAYKPKNGDYWAFDDKESNVAIYGYLYFWETAKAACPLGWHIPSKDEWVTLTNFLGGKNIAGIELKATNGWNRSTKEVTNSSGFSVLPGGNRSVGGPYYHLGDDALFWTSTPKSNRSAWKVRFNYNWDSVGFQACSRLTGLSVRCIKD